MVGYKPINDKHLEFLKEVYRNYKESRMLSFAQYAEMFSVSKDAVQKWVGVLRQHKYIEKKGKIYPTPLGVSFIKDTAGLVDDDAVTVDIMRFVDKTINDRVKKMIREIVREEVKKEIYRIEHDLIS